MMGTSQVTRTRTEMERLQTNLKVRTKIVSLYILVEELAGPIGPHHDGLDHRYGGHGGCKKLGD